MTSPPAAPQNFVKQLVGAPVMITLPIAYAADWYSSDPRWDGPRDYLGRLIYVVINTAILTLVLAGVISISEAGA